MAKNNEIGGRDIIFHLSHYHTDTYQISTLIMSASPCFSRVTREALLRSTLSPTPSVDVLDRGMNVLPPAAIMKQTELPYSLGTTCANNTALISSSVKARLAFTLHLPAYTLRLEKIFISLSHPCPWDLLWYLAHRDVCYVLLLLAPTVVPGTKGE